MGLRKKLKKFIKQIIVRSFESQTPASDTSEQVPPLAETLIQAESPKPPPEISEPEPASSVSIQQSLHSSAEQPEVSTQTTLLPEESTPEAVLEYLTK